MSWITKNIIDKFKNKKTFDTFYFQTKDKNGLPINVDGIVSPLERDNRDLVSPVEDQKDSPFCAAYSICTIFESLYWKKYGKLINLDQDHVYARTKELDGNTEDGSSLESAIKACCELLKIDFQTIGLKLYFNDRTQKTVDNLKHLIHKYDLVHGGFMIDDGWLKSTHRNYIIKQGRSSLGGHAVTVSGYSPEGVFITNSWGQEWGSFGMAILPWELVLKQLIYVAVFDIPDLKI